MKRPLSGLFFSAWLVAVTSVGLCAEPPGQIEDLLLGRWTLVSWLVTDDSGNVTEPFGAEPRGVMGYSDSGTVGIDVKDPDAVLPDLSSVNPNVVQAWIAAMSFSYNGIYEVDHSRMRITHNVEDSTNASHRGRAYQWHVDSIDRDSLVLLVNFEDEVGTHGSLRGLNSTRWIRAH